MGKKLRNLGLSLLDHKYLWTILFFVLVVGFFDPNSFWHRYELHHENQQLRDQINELEERYQADTRELREIETSPEAVERVARVNLYMRTADEDVYVIED